MRSRVENYRCCHILGCLYSAVILSRKSESVRRGEIMENDRIRSLLKPVMVYRKLDPSTQHFSNVPGGETNKRTNDQRRYKPRVMFRDGLNITIRSRFSANHCRVPLAIYCMMGKKSQY